MDRRVLSGSIIIIQTLPPWQARKESTCSVGGVLLDSDDLPMGVIRERGIERCCMIDGADGGVETARCGLEVQVQMMRCVELGGRIV